MRAFLCLLLLVVTPGCDFLTDAATRAAFEIEAATHEMRRQGLASYEFTHIPKTWPEGVDGPWELVIHESSQIGQGGLGLGRYGTSYHTRFVRVPRTLRIAKQAGEGCVIVLRRNGDAIELVGLR
jgi:hypothetical protein